MFPESAWKMGSFPPLKMIDSMVTRGPHQNKLVPPWTKGSRKGKRGREFECWTGGFFVAYGPLRI